MNPFLAMIFCLLVGGATLQGAPVLSIKPKVGTIQIPHEKGKRWQLGERACASPAPGDKTAERKCGIVSMTTAEYAVVELEKPKKETKSDAPAKKEEPKEGKKEAKVQEKKEEKREDRKEAAAPKSSPPIPAPKRVRVVAPPPVAAAAPSALGAPPYSEGGELRPRRVSSYASSETSAGRDSKLSDETPWYGYAQINAFGGFKSTGENSISVQASWNPTFRLDEAFAIRANFGFTLLKNAAGGLIPVIESTALLSMGPGPFVFEVGGGAQSWLAPFSATWGVVSATGAILIRSDTGFARYVDRFFVGSSLLFSAPDQTYQLKAGLGFRL